MSEVRATIDAGVPGAVEDAVTQAGDLTLQIAAPTGCSRSRASSRRAPLSFDAPVGPDLLRLARAGRRASAWPTTSSRSGAARGCDCGCGPGEEPEVDSVTGVWATANWHEREVYDMFGVRFRGHPDLARILMPLDWEGHPLRRDYPLGGEEVEFSDAV